MYYRVDLLEDPRRDSISRYFTDYSEVYELFRSRIEQGKEAGIAAFAGSRWEE